MHKIESIFINLKEIRTYLIKIGRERRTGSILKKTFLEAKAIYDPLHAVVDEIKGQIQKKEIKEEDLVILEKLIRDIHEIYSEIVTLTNVEIIEPKTSSGNKMSSFDIKVAMQLLPVLDSSEKTTEQLIESAQFYSSMLDDGGKASLINFILKTRLSTNAKLRLETSYSSLDGLIADLKKYFLPVKSHTALQSKLMNAKQGHKSISDFGKELEDLFVNLTISQSKGNSDSHNVLKSINEKNAVKKFADGLNNQKLSTIITSRNYDRLKDAIQGALDEEITIHSNPQIYRFHQKRPQYQKRQFTNNKTRHNQNRTAVNNVSDQQTSRRSNQHFHKQWYPSRGRGGYSNSRRYNNRETVRVGQEEDNAGRDDLNYFFRANNN